MSAIPFPVLGEIFLIAMSSLVAVFEGWLFWYGKRREHLWAALLAISVALLGGLMFKHFGVRDVPTAVVLTRLEGVMITSMVHCLLAFTVAVAGERLPGPKHWLAVSWAGFTLLLLSPWLVTGVAPQRMALLPEPFLRRTLNVPLIGSQIYGFALVALATFWIYRHRQRRPREARFFLVGVVLWVAFGLVSALATALSDDPYPGALVEYGFGAFALCIVAAHITDYVLLLEQSQMAREDAVSELETVQKREIQTAQSFVALIQHAPEPMAIRRGDQLVHVNRAMVEALGYERAEDLIDVAYSDILLSSDDMETTGEAQAPTRWRCRDGGARHMEVIPLDVELDERPATVLIGRDITEQRELTARMMQLDRMIAVGTLAAGVGHEINNPLSYLMLSLDEARTHLADASDEQPALMQCLSDAEEAAERITSIVDSLRSSSRTDDAREALRFEETVKAAVAMTAHQAKHRATIETHITSRSWVRANKARLTQVFVNLIMNAVHALPEDEPQNLIVIRVFDAAGGEEVVSEVTDNGAGMSKETRRRAFDPFFTTKAVGVGTGLGLSICQDTVGALGGRLEADSTMGRGTTMRVTVPVCEPVRQVARASAPPPKLNGRPHVLVVDDEPILLVTIRRALSSSFDVTAVSAAREALALLDEGLTPIIILSDLMMPDMSGMQFHAMVKERHEALEPRMLFMSGGAFTAESQRFCGAMEGRLLTKPLRWSTLTRAIQRHAAEVVPPLAPPAPE